MPRLPRSPAIGRRRGAVARWQLAAGIAIHLVLPAYIAALAIDAALGGLGADVATAVPRALAFGVRFVAVYGGIAALATGLAAVGDRLAPRALSPPRADAAARIAAAVAQGRGRFGPAGDAALSALADAAAATVRPDILADDLAMLVGTALSAIDAAPGDAAAIADTTVAALARMAGWATGAAQERAAAVADAARAHSNFVNAKYGSGNFAISPAPPSIPLEPGSAQV